MWAWIIDSAIKNQYKDRTVTNQLLDSKPIPSAHFSLIVSQHLSSQLLNNHESKFGMALLPHKMWRQQQSCLQFMPCRDIKRRQHRQDLFNYFIKKPLESNSPQYLLGFGRVRIQKSCILNSFTNKSKAANSFVFSGEKTTLPRRPSPGTKFVTGN